MMGSIHDYFISPLDLRVIIAQKIAIYTQTDWLILSFRPFSQSSQPVSKSVIRTVSLQKTQSLVSQLAQSAASTMRRRLLPPL